MRFLAAAGVVGAVLFLMAGPGRPAAPLRPAPWQSLPWTPMPVQACCKVCSAGKACGDTCIARDRRCKKGRGCACDAE